MKCPATKTKPEAAAKKRRAASPKKTQIIPDAAAMPERATGQPYRIEDNCGMPFCCYVRDDGVSVFRQRQDGYIDDGDFGDDISQRRLFYTQEVLTISNPIKTWIGIDKESRNEHGNSILVQVPRLNQGKILTAAIEANETCDPLLRGTQALSVTCTDVGGSMVLAATLPEGSVVAELVQKVAALSDAPPAHVRCCDSKGEVVAQDQPLKQHAQLTLQDTTASYVYIGMEIVSFDSSEAVTEYYSIIPRYSSVHHPMAVTTTTVISLKDLKYMKKALFEDKVKGYWDNSYDHFGGASATPLANVEMICERVKDWFS